MLTKQVSQQREVLQSAKALLQGTGDKKVLSQLDKLHLPKAKVAVDPELGGQAHVGFPDAARTDELQALVEIWKGVFYPQSRRNSCKGCSTSWCVVERQCAYSAGGRGTADQGPEPDGGEGTNTPGANSSPALDLDEHCGP